MKKKMIVGLIVFVLFCGVFLVNSSGGNRPAAKPEVRSLPAPRTTGNMSVEQAIAGRRSIRSFSGKSLSEKQISQLLWAAQGITDRRNGFRAAPSAGALYPLEIYSVTAKEICRYLPEKHALEIIKKGDFRKTLSSAALGQSCVAGAPVVFVITAVIERTTSKYGKRGTQYVYMEAGHAAQNIHLQAVALNLGSVPVGAFKEDAVEKLLNAGKGEKVLYIVPVGGKL